MLGRCVFGLVLLIASTAAAQRAVIIELPGGQLVGIAYLPSGESVILTSVEFLKVPKPEPPAKKVDRVTYVFEKDTTLIPRPVSLALRKLNDSGILATEFEQDTVTGLGQTPRQYSIALKAAKSAGLPALVFQAGDQVTAVVRNPKTERDVMEPFD